MRTGQSAPDLSGTPLALHSRAGCDTVKNMNKASSATEFSKILLNATNLFSRHNYIEMLNILNKYCEKAAMQNRSLPSHQESCGVVADTLEREAPFVLCVLEQDILPLLLL